MQHGPEALTRYGRHLHWSKKFSTTMPCKLINLDCNEFFQSTSVFLPCALPQVATKPESVLWL